MSRKYIYKCPHPRYHRIVNAVRLTGQLSPSPDRVDLRHLMLFVRNQGAEGSCSGFSTAAHAEGLQSAASNGLVDKTIRLSPAYLYGRTRMAEGNFPRDTGATVADEMNTLFHYGACSEKILPYSGLSTEAPTPESDKDAEQYRCLEPVLVEHADVVNIEAALAANQTVVFGMGIYDSFENVGRDGVIPMPDYIKDKFLGGHAMLIVGYDREKQVFIVRNSWGVDWADCGYCYIPYAMVALFYEAWTSAVKVA